MNRSEIMIRSMLQAQDEPIRTEPTRPRKHGTQSTTVRPEDVLRFHVKSMLARDRALSQTKESSVLLKKKPQRLPIRDAARLPEPTFNKAKHEKLKKEVALRKMAKKLQQRAKMEKKQRRKSVK